MADWTEADLKRQLAALQKAGWDAHFKTAATAYDLDPTLLIAVSSRETNIRNIVGDGGHGYGLMQIDDRSYPDWCHSGLWKDPQAAIVKGAQVLDSKLEAVRAAQGKKLTVGGTSFTCKSGLSPAELTQTAVAAYNSGLWSCYGLSVRDDPDVKTTGHDYSADVLKRQAVFQELIGPPAA